MDLQGYAIGLFTAAWLGVLTSISPCPLTTNIAAISFISRRSEHPLSVFGSGVFYTLGRAVTYAAIGAILVGGLLSAPVVSAFLQKYMNRILGPVLIVTGVFLLELIKLNLSISAGGEKSQRLGNRGGIISAMLLGIIFALSFCPVSAAIFFFGGLVSVSVKHNSFLMFPLVYGVGTALPVIVFAMMIAGGAKLLASAFRKITVFEKWSRRITGAIFIAAGIYYCLAYIFEIF